MNPNQICSEQRCSGDRFNPGGGWIFVKTSVLNSAFGSENADGFRAATGNLSGADSIVRETSAVVCPNCALQHRIGLRWGDLGPELVQHSEALTVCAQKPPPTESIPRSASATKPKRTISRMLLEVASTCNRYSLKHDKPFNDAAHRAVTAIDVWLDSILHHSQSPDLTPAQFLSKCRTDAQREVHPPSFYPTSS